MKRPTLIALIVLCCLPQASAASTPASYRGVIHPPIPTGCNVGGGGIFGSDQAGNELAFTHVECNGKKMIWLERFLHREGKRAIWQVEDVITLPALRKKQSIFDIDCESKHNSSAQIIAIGTWVARKVGGYVKDITHAWILDPTSKRIVRISPGEVSCEVNEDRD